MIESAGVVSDVISLFKSAGSSALEEVPIESASTHIRSVVEIHGGRINCALICAPLLHCGSSIDEHRNMAGTPFTRSATATLLEIIETFSPYVGWRSSKVTP